MSISFDEARHVVCKALGYDAELATTVLMAAMHSGQLRYSASTTQGSNNTMYVTTGLPPSVESGLTLDDLHEFIDSRRSLNPSDSEQAQPSEADSKLDIREKKAMSLVIGMLLQIVIGKVPGNPGKGLFDTQDALARYIAEKYDGYYGVSLRSLQDKFSAANKQLDEG